MNQQALMFRTEIEIAGVEKYVCSDWKGTYTSKFTARCISDWLFGAGVYQKYNEDLAEEFRFLAHLIEVREGI